MTFAPSTGSVGPNPLDTTALATLACAVAWDAVLNTVARGDQKPLFFELRSRLR